MKKRVLTTLIAFVLLAAVIAAGLNAIFTVTYVRATFRTYTEKGVAAAEVLKEQLNGYVNRSSVFLDLSEVRATVEADPRFEVVTIAKEYPETISVEVVERREAFAILNEDGSYTVLDEEGVILDTVSSSDGYILLEGFTLSEADGSVSGEYFDELLAPASGWNIFRIYMHEGAPIDLLNPAERAGEMAAAATQSYLAMTDAQRVWRTITATVTSEGEIAVDIGSLS